MLREMREKTKFVMLIVALAFVGLMVFEWGMDMSGRSAPTVTGTVGQVNGTEISYREWTQAYRNLSDQAREQKGAALNDAELEQIEEQTWNQLVNQILIEQELDRRGIGVTDEEVRMAFRTTPPPWLTENELFQTDGQFDYEKYQQFFSGPAVDPNLLMQIEQYYRQVLPRSRLLEQVSSGIYVSDSELWQFYRDRNEEVRVRYVALDPETLVSDTAITVTEDELRRYYQDHREDFEQPTTATVKLVSLTRTTGPADTAAALSRAQEIRRELREGADFAELAREHSADPGTADRGGDLGWFGRGEISPAFERAAFQMEPGEISEPVLTQVGYHIIRVEDRQEDRVRASHILIPIELRGDSENELLGRVDRLEGIALRQGLEAGADSISVPVREVTLSENSDFVPGIGSFGSPHDWAFHDSTFVGDLSPVYETGDGFYVFELVGRQPAGVLPFAEAEPALRRRVTLEKKMDRTRDLAREIAAELSESSLSDVARAHGLEPQTTDYFTRMDFVPGLGQANAAVGTAFGLEENEVGGPVEADDRLYLVELLDRRPADRERFRTQQEQLRARLIVQRRENALDEWISDLRERAKIVDMRRDFFQPG